MTKQLAKQVYAFDTQAVIDRTQQPHPLGLFDIDFRKSDALNPKAREWSYGATKRTLDQAIKGAEEIMEKTGAETRIVRADTGEILKKLSRVV